MFDEDEYYSDEQDNLFKTRKAIPTGKTMTPTANSDFNHLTGDGQTILKMMKDRGFDLTQNQIKKFKLNNHSPQKQAKQAKARSGFFDGGASATLEQLIKALNKALSKADPQQASAILSYILQRKTLSVQDLNKFGVMKCKILFGLGAYKDCQLKAQQLVCKACNKLKTAVFSNYLAKCKAQNNKILQGYLDLLRSKTLISQVKAQQEQKAQSANKQDTQQNRDQKKQVDDQRKKLQLNFKDSQVDSILRQIDYTQMEYNIKMAELKNTIQVVHPHFPMFRHRRIKQIACGDYHVIFLVEGSFDNAESSLNPQWKTQVFAMGQNSVGQATGKASPQLFKEPILIPQLSGKGITGIFAYKQSSIAFNATGEIYQWGVKQDRNDQISLTYTVGQQIQSLQKGNKHYALLTKSKKFYTWGQIQSRGVVIYKQTKPQMQQSTNITSFSCGNSCVICVDSYGQAFALGSNESGQTCVKGEYFTKAFKKIPDNVLGKIIKVFCISDCTFFINFDDEIYFTGKYSHNKQAQQSIRQAQFAGDIRNVINMCGHIGCYYLTNQKGEIFKWDVDSNVKFRIYKQNYQISQRYVAQNRGHLFRAKSLVQPEFCSIKQITETLQSYEQIKFQMQLRDRYGFYGNKQFLISPRCQIHLSTYQMTSAEILKQNKQFLEKYKLSTSQNRILLNEIIDPKLYSYIITRNQEETWLFDLEIVIDTAGKYFFYVILQQNLLYSQQLYIQKSVKQGEQSQKNLAEKKTKDQQRRKRTQQEKRRLLEQKLRKQKQQQQKRKQTQRRAEQALKKYMKQQEQTKLKQIEQRKARKQLQTGGGFDLSKLAKRNSTQLKGVSSKIQSRPQIMQKTNQSFMKSSQSFLPDINNRPSSRRKLNIGKDSIDSTRKSNALHKTAGFPNDTKVFLQTKTKEIRQIGKNLTSDGPKLKQMGELNKNVGVKPLLKRALTKTKK